LDVDHIIDATLATPRKIRGRNGRHEEMRGDEHFGEIDPGEGVIAGLDEETDLGDDERVDFELNHSKYIILSCLSILRAFHLSNLAATSPVTPERSRRQIYSAV
jgi:hypothetical protein